MEVMKSLCIGIQIWTVVSEDDGDSDLSSSEEN